uniref:Sororin C-terminal region domain-containing protein n=1 Tax=Arundo donax TaxID=35708 RepID=A0A0A9ES14_ARUDO
MAPDTWPISSSAPCHEAKKKRPSSSTHKLPEEFVKKYKAYFADIDAFELPEEEVSETDLE